MIDGLKPYPEYKDSGWPWAERVPSHWQLIPNRGLIRKRKVLVGKNHCRYQLLSLTKQGVIVRDVTSGKGKFSSDMGTSQEVRTGDLVFCLFDVPETPRTVGLSPYNGMITGAYTVFEFLNPERTRYFESFYIAMDDRKLLSPLYSGQRDKLDPILDACVAVYKEKLDEDGQVDFKGKAKAFARTYDFLASVMPYAMREWEKLSIVLNLLIPKLPAPIEEDLSKGLLEAIDMDSYRVEKKAVMKIALADENAEIGPVPVEGGGHKREPELDRLSNILKTFNEHFGTLFTDGDRVFKRIKDDIAPKVAANQPYLNAKQNTPHTARIAHDKALEKVMQVFLKDDTEVYKQFVENEGFRRFVTDMVYALTNE